MKNLTALDIETTGLNPKKDKITCVGQWSPETSSVQRNLLKLTLAAGGFIGHNFKFDTAFLAEQNIDVATNWIHDTRILAHVTNSSVPEEWLKDYEELRQIENKRLPHGITHRQAGPLSLKTLAPYHLGVPAFWEDPSNHDNDEYVLKDCRYTYELFEMLWTQATEEEKKFYLNHSMPWEKMLYDASKRGITLDKSQLEAVRLEHEALASELKEQLDLTWMSALGAYEDEQLKAIKQKYDLMYLKAVEKAKDKDKCALRYKRLYQAAAEKMEAFNYASSKQMTWLLRDYLKLDITTEEGKESTEKEVLERLARDREDVALFLKWRKASKILTAFLPAYEELAHNGVIHPEFNSTGTRTGRLSSSNPNMQQVPSGLYKLFRPREDYTFLQHDAAAIEAKLIAYYSEDPNLYKIISSGDSIHNYNAKIFFNLSCDPSEVPEKYPWERKLSKTVGFALFYGAGFRRIKASFANGGHFITETQAREMHANFKEFYKTAISFHREITKVFESGDTLINLFGRPLKIRNKEDAYMKGFNTLIQSSASDLNLAAAYDAKEEWKMLGLDSHLLLFVHDFVLAECRKDQATIADEILIKHMTKYDLTNRHGKITLEVDGGISDEWTK